MKPIKAIRQTPQRARDESLVWSPQDGNNQLGWKLNREMVVLNAQIMGIHGICCWIACGIYDYLTIYFWMDTPYVSHHNGPEQSQLWGMINGVLNFKDMWYSKSAIVIIEWKTCHWTRRYVFQVSIKGGV